MSGSYWESAIFLFTVQGDGGYKIIFFGFLWDTQEACGHGTNFWGVQWPVLQKSHLVTSLNNLQKVIISQCRRLKEEDIIDWLDRLTSWMTDSDLAMLTQNCRSLCQLSLAGCKFLTSDAQNIIASGWPRLRRIHLENCSKVTANGVSHILECRAMENLLLRHNSSGIQRNFALEAVLKLPLL